MTGMIRRRGKESWEVRIELGRNPVDGNRRQRNFTVRGAKKDAKRALAEAVHQRDTGFDIAPSRMTVAEYLDRWLRDYATPNVRPSTHQRYGEITRRIARS